MLSPLGCLPTKTGGAVNGGAYAPFILTVDWLGWFCHLFSYSHLHLLHLYVQILPAKNRYANRITYKSTNQQKQNLNQSITIIDDQSVRIK